MARLAASSNVNTNPYTTVQLCCASVRTKEHAQLIGIVSLAVFVCLVVISYSIFGAFSVAYIACGIVVYGFFMESLLRKPNKFALLGYVTFEALQIAFYLSLAVYIMIPLFYGNDDWVCPVRSSFDSSITTTTEPCPSWAETRSALTEILVFVLFLLSLKTYFTRVILHLYKYYSWLEEHAGDMRAQYVNGRGVQINVDDNIFPPPPAWNPQGVAFAQPVPTYDEAISMNKPPAVAESPAPTDAESRSAVQREVQNTP